MPDLYSLLKLAHILGAAAERFGVGIRGARLQRFIETGGA